jgi:hypothetical protein
MLYGFKTFMTINHTYRLVVIPVGYLRYAGIRYCSEEAPQRRKKKMLGELILGGNCAMTTAGRTIKPRVTFFVS